MVVSLVGFAVLVYLGVPVHLAYQKFIQLATAAILFSYLLSVYLYMRALSAANQDLAEGGNSGG